MPGLENIDILTGVEDTAATNKVQAKATLNILICCGSALDYHVERFVYGLDSVSSYIYTQIF